MTDQLDITFVGHICYDEITPFQGQPYNAPGSAVLCGAMAAVRTGRRIAAVVRMAPADQTLLQPMRDAGITVFLVPATETTLSRVIHPSPNLDEREMAIVRDAGFFTPADLPPLRTTFLHLAGISNREFNLDFIHAVKRTGVSLSADLQSFVRQINPATRVIEFRDVPAKKEIVALLDKVKLDVVEAELLTGRTDLGAAAAEIAAWGCPEVLITRADGVLAQVQGKQYFEPFSNRSNVGRTGRGDTTFAAYLCRRIDHPPRESLKFAAALVSLKMEAPRPFSGTVNDVLQRMALCHAD